MKKFFNKSNLQIVSSRINEVHCGIFDKIKKYRNSLHSCGMTHFNLCHPELVSGSHQPEMLNIVDFIKSLFVKRFSMTYLKKALAFTLAETLVVMGIIGVVAALTIPNLNQSTGDREKVAKLKKVYANFSDAFGRATAVYGPIDEWFINDSVPSSHQRLADRMTEFMKISKNCGTDESGCFPEEDYKNLAGDAEDTPMNWDEEPMYLLADGTAVDFYVFNKDCSNSGGQLQNELCGYLYVDIDGVKGSNTLGKDYFRFYVAKSGIYPEGAQIVADDSAYGKSCFNYGGGCAGWIIEMGNMDYLKASEGKCPNGTMLSVDNPTCK